MLEVINAGFDYSDTPVLQGVQFSLSAGHLLHISGCNGAGKTTLLKLLAGILQPAVGEIRYHGESITKNRVEYQQALCYVGHKSGVSPLLTVRENLRYNVHAPSTKVFDALIKRLCLIGRRTYRVGCCLRERADG